MNNRATNNSYFGKPFPSSNNKYTVNPTKKVLSDQALFIKRSLQQIGYDPDDIDIVLHKHNGKVLFNVATQELRALRDKRKQEEFNMQNRNYYPSNVSTVIISSDDESDDDSIVCVGEFRKPSSPIVIDKSAEPKFFSEYAEMDMPSNTRLETFLNEKYYQTTQEYNCVLANEMVDDFCKHFKLPNYSDLGKLFIDRVSRDLFSKDPCFKNVRLQGEKDRAHFIFLRKKTGSGPKQKRGIITDWLNSGEELHENNREELTCQTISGDSSSVSKPVVDKQPTPLPRTKASNKSAKAANSQITLDKEEETFSSQIQQLRDEIPSKRVPSPSSSIKSMDIQKRKYSNHSSQPFKRVPSPSSSVTPMDVHQSRKPSKTAPSPNSSLMPMDVQQQKHSNQVQQPRKPLKKVSLPTSSVTPMDVQQSKRFNHVKQPTVPSPGFSSVTPMDVQEPSCSNHMQQPPHSQNTRKTTQQLLKLPQTPGHDYLRPIIIDGSNVACTHGNHHSYSCRGIAICVNYFWQRGHRHITCFVPHFRKKKEIGNPPIKDQIVLFQLEQKGICKFTPSREIQGRLIVCYDDRFILLLAEESGGVVVSNDQYRDLRQERSEWKDLINKRLLPYVFVGDLFMPPHDPLGRTGPTLDDFLSFSRKSLNKSDPRIVHQMIPPSPRTLIEKTATYRGLHDKNAESAKRRKLEKDLLVLFPDKHRIIQDVMNHFPETYNLNELANYLLQMPES